MNNGNPWPPEDDKLLISVWPMIGSRCAHMFPDRTILAIRWRVKFLARTNNMKRDFKNGEPGHRKGMTKPRKAPPPPRKDRTIANTKTSRDGIARVASVFDLARHL